MSNKWENRFNFDSDSDSDESGKETVDEKDYYSILGVSQSSLQEEIKKSYREKARKLHPDKHPDETEKYKILFQELGEAYSILSDPNKRKIYDKHGKAGIKNQNFLIPRNKQDLERLFQMVFDEDEKDRDDGNHTKLKKPQCAPIRAIATLPPLVPGQAKWCCKYTIKRIVICTFCLKFDPETHERCFACAGKGELDSDDVLPSLREKKKEDCSMCQSKGHITIKKNQFQICPKCNGDKTITTTNWKFHHRKVTCSFCRGRQWYCKSCHNYEHIHDEETIDVVAFPGTKHNEQRIYYGFGNKLKDYETGDVIVTFKLVGDHSKHTVEDTKYQPSGCKQM